MNSEPLLVLEGMPFNVRNFGAVGNGIADDTAAIQQAIDAALAYSGNGAPCVLIPEGRYLINRHLQNPECLDGRLVLGASHGGKLHIRGEGNATLFSTVDAWPDGTWDILLAIWGPDYTDVLIENLTFQRAPSPIGERETMAIASQGTRTRIRDCTFIDFPQAVRFEKAASPLVSGCRWIYTDGVACGRGPGGTGIYPNVGIRCDNGCSDVQIVDNIWSGTENVAHPKALYPMDGFIWGYSRGWSIRGNFVRRVFVEGIYCCSSPQGDPTSSAIIEGNTIDCDYPSSLPPALIRGAVRMAIRADDWHVLIRGNHIFRSRSPISVNNYAMAGPGRAGGIISGNSIVFDAFDTAQVGTSVLFGIALQNRQSMLIQGNQILFPTNSVGSAAANLPSTGITVTNCGSIRIMGNMIEAAGVPTPAQSALWAFYLSGSNDVVISGNVVANFGKLIGHAPGSTATVEVQGNTLFEVSQAS